MLTGVAVATLTFAGAAQADAQDDYLNALAAKGFQMNDPQTTQVYLWGGNKACDDMHNGMSPAEAKRDIATPPADGVHKPVGSNAALISTMVETAQQKLCPDTQRR